MKTINFDTLKSEQSIYNTNRKFILNNMCHILELLDKSMRMDLSTEVRNAIYQIEKKFIYLVDKYDCLDLAVDYIDNNHLCLINTNDVYETELYEEYSDYMILCKLTQALRIIFYNIL